MAQAFDTAGINALTREKFVPLLVDNIFDSNIMAKKYLANADKLDGGRVIITPLEVAKASAYGGFYHDYDAQTIDTNDVHDKATWTWVQAYQGVNLSNREIAINSGDSQVLSLLTATTFLPSKSAFNVPL